MGVNNQSCNIDRQKGTDSQSAGLVRDIFLFNGTQVRRVIKSNARDEG